MSTLYTPQINMEAHNIQDSSLIRGLSTLPGYSAGVWSSGRVMLLGSRVFPTRSLSKSKTLAVGAAIVSIIIVENPIISLRYHISQVYLKMILVIM